jgi:hypothetical protein
MCMMGHVVSNTDLTHKSRLRWKGDGSWLRIPRWKVVPAVLGMAYSDFRWKLESLSP